MGFSRNSPQPPGWGYRISRGFSEDRISRGFRHFEWGYPGVQPLIRGYPGVNTNFIVRISRGFPFLGLDIQGVLKLEKSISSIGGLRFFSGNAQYNFCSVFKKHSVFALGWDFYCSWLNFSTGLLTEVDLTWPLIQGCSHQSLG